MFNFVLSTIGVPLATWILQYRSGDRLKINLYIEHVVEGEFDLYGNRIALTKAKDEQKLDNQIVPQ